MMMYFCEFIREFLCLPYILHKYVCAGCVHILPKQLHSHTRECTMKDD